VKKIPFVVIRFLEKEFKFKKKMKNPESYNKYYDRLMLIGCGIKNVT
jgi:hypothetical protein